MLALSSIAHADLNYDTTQIFENSDESDGLGAVYLLAYASSISRDGRFIVYTKDSPQEGTNSSVYPIPVVYDSRTGSSRELRDALYFDTWYTGISGDGKYLLSDGDSIAITNLESGQADEIVSNFNGQPIGSHISGDGKYVAFSSKRVALDPPDPNELVVDAFFYDRLTKRSRMISRGSSGPSFATDISADGRFIVFDTLGDELDPRDTNGAYDVYLYDRVEQRTEMVSSPADGDSRSGKISASGRYLAFESNASSLCAGDTNSGLKNVIFLDRQTGTSTCITDGTTGDNSLIQLSSDGRFVLIKGGEGLLVDSSYPLSTFFVFDTSRMIYHSLRTGPDLNAERLLASDDLQTIVFDDTAGPFGSTYLGGLWIGKVGDPFCGYPIIDKSVDSGAFLWRECNGSNRWQYRVVGAPKSGKNTFAGRVYGPVSSLERFQLEPDDSLVNDGTAVDYRFTLWNNGVDGFRFHTSGSDTCFEATDGLPVYAGAFRFALGTGPHSLSDAGPCMQDTDMDDDGLTDGAEVFYGTDPSNSDSDYGGVIDGFEIRHGLDPLDAQDDLISGCGKPRSFPSSPDESVYVWRDCNDAGERWQIRVTGGGSVFHRYTGEISADAPLDIPNRVALENPDVLDTVPMDNVIDFSFLVGGKGMDGFSFRLDEPVAACFEVEDARTPIRVGYLEVQIAPPFSLNTLLACNAPAP